MHVSELLNVLLQVGEKATRIAQIIRSEQALLNLLTEEKTEIKKNERFYQDFKTLADVLIQETVNYYIGKEVPAIKENIFGEESNSFTNALGERIEVKVCDTPEDTAALLAQILSGNTEAAQLLSQAVHSQPPEFPKHLTDSHLDIPVDQCGIWIDPIDGTSQYINGEIGSESQGVYTQGLQCVAILIGLFHTESGRPIMGLVRQPFHLYNTQTHSWSTNTIWGVSYGGESHTSLACHTQQHTDTSDKHTDTSQEHSGALASSPVQKQLVMSPSEAESVQTRLGHKYKLLFASGAGYKLVTSILGPACAYVLSHRSIYRWDCCAVHAVLRALGGGIVSYKHVLEKVQGCGELSYDALADLQVSYTKDAGTVCGRKNSVSDGTESLPGIIAYRDPRDVVDIVRLLV